MAILDTRQGFGVPSRALHWISAALVALAWLAGETMEALPKGGPRAAGLELHQSLGTLVFALAALRLLWRALNRRPAPPPGVPEWQERVAGLAHAALYALMLLLPASGLLARWGEGRTVQLFWTWVLAPPAWAGRLGDAFEDVHEALSTALLVLVGLHVAAALWHHFVLRDGVLRQMLRGTA